MLLPNVPTWSNVIALWSEEGHPDAAQRKQREGTCWMRGLKDVLAFCDENVARGEPGRRGLRWSDSHVFFHHGRNGGRKRPEQRAIPVAVDRIDVLGCTYSARVANDPGQRPRLWAGDAMLAKGQLDWRRKALL